MKIAVLMITYNSAKYLSRAVASVYNQGYDNFDLYICDDVSTDSTVQIITDLADKDSRVHPILLKTREEDRFFKHPYCFLSYAVGKYNDEDFVCIIDPDDELHCEFFSKMINFMNNNDLGWAACGFDTVNGADNSVVSSRLEDIICDGKYLAGYFPKYRRFTCDHWGKLYRISTLKKIIPPWGNNGLSLFEDQLRTIHYEHLQSPMYNLEAIKLSNRVGILPVSLYKYYIYPDSTYRTYRPSTFGRFKKSYELMRNFLLSYGEISKENQDYIFAVYWGMMIDLIDVLKQCEISFEQKLKDVLTVFKDPVTKECLIWDADPTYRNLSERSSYIQGIFDWIEQQPDSNLYSSIINEIKTNIEIEGLK